MIDRLSWVVPIGHCYVITSVLWVVARALLSDSGWLLMCSYVVTRVFQNFRSLDMAPVPPLMYVYGNVYIYFPPFYRPPDENHKSYSLEKR